ncbi:MAG: DUF488 domain-containing protein [Hyphomicrobiaceae bacterium]
MVKKSSHERADAVCIKRAYVSPAEEDGCRVLVDRLWPRGVARKSLALDEWQKDVAPSADLRRWFNHDPARWDEFKTRYRAELAKSPAREALSTLVRLARQGKLTLIYAARDENHNEATVLRDVILRRLREKPRARRPCFNRTHVILPRAGGRS